MIRSSLPPHSAIEDERDHPCGKCTWRCSWQSWPVWRPCGSRRGQGIQPQTLYARQRRISIPFDPDPAEAHRLKQLKLYYSTDRGLTWIVGATAAPDQRKFDFTAEADGFYLFAVQTTDLNGRNYPEKMDGVAPGLRVMIDTVAPIVSLRQLPPQGNQVGVAWDIRDDNFDLSKPDALRLEYRPPGSATWLPLFPPRGAIQYYWAPGSSGVVDVKLRATDLAGNFTDASTQVSLGSQQGGGFGPGGLSAGSDVTFQSGPTGVPLDPGRRFVNNKRITLNYEIERGPSGISGIDLWMTNDGRGWSKFQLPKNAIGDATFNGPITFEVPAEGVYGFTLIPRSGVGISPPAPQVGEKPQIWIEVDTTKPFVQVDGVLVGQGDFKGQLSISWTAKDKNLGPRPISRATPRPPKARGRRSRGSFPTPAAMCGPCRQSGPCRGNFTSRSRPPTWPTTPASSSPPWSRSTHFSQSSKSLTCNRESKRHQKRHKECACYYDKVVGTLRVPF